MLWVSERMYIPRYSVMLCLGNKSVTYVTNHAICFNCYDCPKDDLRVQTCSRKT
jgi:hypothetical protein